MRRRRYLLAFDLELSIRPALSLRQLCCGQAGLVSTLTISNAPIISPPSLEVPFVCLLTENPTYPVRNCLTNFL